MSKTVVWERLMLRGFGCYRGTVEVTFDAGLNNAVAPNEYGKSTLVAGLVAVLFGLPNTSDASRFGKARFRNWDGPERFEGEVQFSVDGVTYRVRRDFDTDRVSLARKQGDHWVELVGGEHRASAKKKNLTYEDTLAGLIGIASADLFWSTFCVEQPLPEPRQLSRSVQELLSGTGTAGSEALDTLEAWLEAKTRRTGQLGVSARDKNKDRELELLEARKADLEQAVEASRAEVDRLHSLQEQLAQLEKEKSGLEAALKDKEALKQAWISWRQFSERYSADLENQMKLRKAQDRARNLSDELSQVTARVEQLYPEFLAAPPNVSEALEELVRVERDTAELRNSIEEIEGKIERYEHEIKELEGLLAGPLAAAVGRPHLVRDHEALEESLEQLKDLDSRLADLSRRENEARSVLDELGAWKALEGKPLAYYQQAAQAALKSYQDLEAALRELAARKRELAERYRVFQEGSPQLVEGCRNYHAEKARLEQEVRDAEAAVRELESRLAHYQAVKENVQRQFSDLAGIPGEAMSAFADKLALEKERQALEEKVRASRAKAAGRAWVAAGLGLLAAGAALWAAGLPAAVSLALLIAGLALGAYGYVSGRRAGASGCLAELAQVRAKLAAVDAKIGPYAECPMDELAVLCERLKQREARQRELEDLYGTLPTEAEQAEAAARVRRAKEALDGFLGLVAPVLSAFSDPQEAYQGWRRAQQEVESLERRAAALAERDFGVQPDLVDSLNLAAVEGWRDVGLLAAAVGEKIETVGQAARWLAALSPEKWADWQAQVDEYGKAQEKLGSCKIERESLDKPDASGRTRRQALAEAIAELRKAVHPFTEETPRDEIARLVAECDRVQKDLESKRAVAKSEQANLDAQRKRLAQLEARQKSLSAELAAVLAPAGGSAMQAKDRWSEWQEMESQRKELFTSLQTLLKTFEASSLSDLELKVQDADNAVVATLSEWRKLVDSRPGLPSIEERGQRDRLEAEFSALNREIESLRAKKEDVEKGIYATNMELHGLLGKQPINIAGAKDEIAELEAQCERLRLETEALALAYKELAAARDLFNATYRDRLAEAASRYFAQMTKSPGRRVALDSEFNVTVFEAEGQRVEVSQLSQGAQDQLQVALRLAIADLIAGDYNLPLVFDDPFLNFDAGRLAVLKETLADLARQGRQILVLSHQETYRGWGSSVNWQQGFPDDDSLA